MSCPSLFWDVSLNGQRLNEKAIFFIEEHKMLGWPNRCIRFTKIRKHCPLFKVNQKENTFSPFQNGDGEVCTSRASSIAPPGFKLYEIFTQCVFVHLSTSLFESSTMYLLTISKRELNPQYLCLLEVPTWLEYNSTSILNWLPLPTVPCFFSPQNSNIHGTPLS